MNEQWIFLLSVFILGIVIYLVRLIIKKIKNKKVCQDGELYFLDEYESSIAYSSETEYLVEIKSRIKRQTFNYIILTTKFKNNQYVMFDIDDLDKYNHFCKNTSYNHVDIQSSPGHHWIIVDKPFSKFEDFIDDELYTDWLVYSHDSYTKMTLSRRQFCLRGTFKTLERQPTILNKVGTLSDDFNQYITKLEIFYEKDSLELSTLQYKEPDMLNKMKRIKKLDRILQTNEI